MDPPAPEEAHAGPLGRLFAGLAALERGERKEHVRVLWLGDSHAAADYWTGALRSRMQKRFGSGGPGYVYLGYKGYRHDGVAIEIEGKWAMRPKAPATGKPTGDGAFGLGGILLRGFEDQPRVSLTLREGEPTTKFTWDLCYKLGAASDELGVTLGAGPRTVLKTASGEAPGAVRHLVMTSVGPTTLKLVPGSGHPELCGVVIERDPGERPGVVLDTVGINGARLGTVLAWNEASWGAEMARRRPDLVILEFGTNEASDAEAKPATFGKQLQQVVGRLRRVAPEVDCAVAAPTDRADAEERMGPIRDALRAAATASGCWFFDSYQVMGGRGSIRKWRDETPPRAGVDGIHLTAKGYKELGVAMYDALMREGTVMGRPDGTRSTAGSTAAP